MKANDLYASKDIKGLIELLDNVSERDAAALALGEIGNASALSPLVARIPLIGRAAEEALERIDPNWVASREACSAITKLVETTKLLSLRWKTISSMPTSPVGYPSIEVEKTVSLRAIEVLAKIENPLAVQALCRVLEDNQCIIRDAAAHALDRIEPNWKKSSFGTEVFNNALIKLKDETSEAREIGVWILGVLGNEEVIKPLIEVVKDKNNSGHLKFQATVHLHKIHSHWAETELAKSAFTELESALKNPEHSVRDMVSIKESLAMIRKARSKGHKN